MNYADNWRSTSTLEGDQQRSEVRGSVLSSLLNNIQSMKTTFMTKQLMMELLNMSLVFYNSMSMSMRMTLFFTCKETVAFWLMNGFSTVFPLPSVTLSWLFLFFFFCPFHILFLLPWEFFLTTTILRLKRVSFVIVLLDSEWHNRKMLCENFQRHFLQTEDVTPKIDFGDDQDVLT